MRTPDLVADAAMAAQDLGNRFTAALAAKDAAALLALFDDPVDFRALLAPGHVLGLSPGPGLTGRALLQTTANRGSHMAGKAVISLTTGLEDPEKVTVAFLVAAGEWIGDEAATTFSY